MPKAAPFGSPAPAPRLIASPAPGSSGALSIPPPCFFLWRRQEVAAVADRFNATAFDIENTHWSHRGELCTFDVMVEEFGLGTEALLRLATIVRAADTATA